MNATVPQDSGSVATVERLAYTTGEACFALGIKRTTLWRLEKLGKIQAIPGLRHKLFPVSSLKRFTDGKAA